MRCPPCHTPMKPVSYVDSCEDSALMWIQGWRCSRCGYEVNPLAEWNRRFLESDGPTTDKQERVNTERRAI